VGRHLMTGSFLARLLNFARSTWFVSSHVLTHSHRITPSTWAPGSLSPLESGSVPVQCGGNVRNFRYL
jgi:hypothetical protein